MIRNGSSHLINCASYLIFLVIPASKLMRLLLRKSLEMNETIRISNFVDDDVHYFVPLFPMIFFKPASTRSRARRLATTLAIFLRMTTYSGLRFSLLMTLSYLLVNETNILRDRPHENSCDKQLQHILLIHLLPFLSSSCSYFHLHQPPIYERCDDLLADLLAYRRGARDLQGQ